MHWESGILTTRLLGKSLYLILEITLSVHICTLIRRPFHTHDSLQLHGCPGWGFSLSYASDQETGSERLNEAFGTQC